MYTHSDQAGVWLGLPHTQYVKAPHREAETALAIPEHYFSTCSFFFFLISIVCNSGKTTNIFQLPWLSYSLSGMRKPSTETSPRLTKADALEQRIHQEHNHLASGMGSGSCFLWSGVRRQVSMAVRTASRSPVPPQT